MTLLSQAARHPEILPILHDATIASPRAAELLAEMGVSTSERAVRRLRQRWVALAPERAVRDGQTETISASVPPVEDTDDEVDALNERVAALTADNRRLYRQYTQAKARGDEMIEAVYRAARDAAVYTASEAPSASRPARPVGPGRPEVALWHLTDWQGYKRTETYNRTIMRERVERYVDKADSITAIQCADHPVEEATLLFTGDMVEGVSIFPGQAWEVDGALYEQMFGVAELMTWTIRQALDIYQRVQVVCEWGNHGRIGRKSDGIKPSDNVDRMVYNIVKEKFADEPRITNFQTSGQWYQHFTIGNYRAVAIHGDEIKSFGGNVPAYGILRKANAWASGVIPAFHDLYMGHYHQSMQLQLANGGSVFMTGSTESDNVYAAEFVAATGRPSQRLNFVDPAKGRVTAEYRLFLEN